MEIGSATLSPALTPGFYLFSMDFLQRFNHEKSSSFQYPRSHHWHHTTGPLGHWVLVVDGCHFIPKASHICGLPYHGLAENQLLQLRQPPSPSAFLLAVTMVLGIVQKAVGEVNAWQFILVCCFLSPLCPPAVQNERKTNLCRRENLGLGSFEH
jgi:hypothetical protein